MYHKHIYSQYFFLFTFIETVSHIAFSWPHICDDLEDDHELLIILCSPLSAGIVSMPLLLT